MKLSEIFRKTVARENNSTDSKTDEPQRKLSEEKFELIHAPDDGKLSGEEIAIGENESGEVEVPPFQPPRPALPEGYVYPDATEAAHFHAELLRELPSNHPLFGVPLQTFAACEGSDDTLFQYRGNSQRFVLVHLTWLGRTEINEDHPGILFTGTFAEFLQREKELYGLEPPA